MKKTLIELFAGVGGFRLGFERNGFETVWANQWEPSKKKQDAYECYIHNFGDSEVHSNEDINKVDEKKLPNHSVLVYGSPCQDYSVAHSNAKGIEGKKGVLFWEVVRLMKEKQPPFMLMENVDRLLKSPSKQRGRDFMVMCKSLNDLGYGLEWRVINAAEYGFPQKRKRIFLFGFHKSTNYYQEFTSQEDKINNGFFSKEFPVESISTKKPIVDIELEDDIVTISDTYQANLHNTGYVIEGKLHSVETVPPKVNLVTLGEILETNVDEKYYLNEDELEAWRYLKGAKSIPRVSKSGHEYTFTEGAIAFPDHLDRPARTMLTSEASKNRSSHVVLDPETNRLRKITPVEAERINGFPDNWTEGLSDRMRYFCMGNALVVGLIEKMGKTLSDIIDKEV